MNSQTAWSGLDNRHTGTSVTRPNLAVPSNGLSNGLSNGPSNGASTEPGNGPSTGPGTGLCNGLAAETGTPQCAVQSTSTGSRPWDSPRTIEQSAEQEDYTSLKDRLATIPTRSKQKRQSLYLDLWTGQHWLGVTLTSPSDSEISDSEFSDSEILKPVSVDTALSVATVGTYRLLNQPLFAKS